MSDDSKQWIAFMIAAFLAVLVISTSIAVVQIWSPPTVHRTALQECAVSSERMNTIFCLTLAKHGKDKELVPNAL